MDHLYHPGHHWINAADALRDTADIHERVHPYVTDDPVFGYITPLMLADFFDRNKIEALRQELTPGITSSPGIATSPAIIWVCGTGAGLIAPDADWLIYADMPRWEIQLRFRRNEIANLGADNAQASFSEQYKRGFFVDWRVCDRHKVEQMERWIMCWIPRSPASLRWSVAAPCRQPCGRL